MTALDRILPTPRLIELDDVELAAPPAVVWEVVRHVDLADAKLLRLLFFLRTLPSRLRGQKPEELRFSIDDMVSTPERPGFQVLVDDPPHEVAVGAIGKVWEPNIPFVHVDGPEAYAAFSAPDMAKVAWAVRVQPWGVEGSRVEVEVRVDTSDDAAWRKFQRYFRVIGIGSHFIRRQVLGALAERFGRPDDVEARRRMPGDELLADAAGEATHGITIQAPPEAIWPWLLQMGCGRAGYYSHDVLDNGGRRSARDLHPELGELSVGQVIAATPESDEGFEVLRIEAPHLLVLGGLYDTADKKQLPFASPRPDDHWQVTWAFLLEPLDTTRTRLSVRARAAGSPSQAGRLRWIGPVHGFMESAQLRNLAARVEGRLPRDDWRDVGEGMLGAGV
ncbi:MAG: hypothetical protein KC731_21070, partial [Myxococcales bacterium]|nr:hypothetical protein [Myxococcales bacterium]